MKKRITALALALAMVMGTAALAVGVEKTITVTPMELSVNGQKTADTGAFAHEGSHTPLCAIFASCWAWMWNGTRTIPPPSS